MLKIFLLLFILFIVFVGLGKITKSSNSKKGAQEQKTAPVKAKMEIGKNFQFFANHIGKKGAEDVSFTLVSAELKDEIMVNSNSRKAAKGSQFLLLRLEIENQTTEKLSFTSSDLIRLISKEGKSFSPDFHNGIVIIDPLSVRKDLVSFIVAEEEKNFTLMVGELEQEEKEKVEIKF